MIANNPLFKHVDRAAYELPDLLKQLGEVDCSKPVPQEQMHMVSAVAQHARNAQNTLLDGLESLGRLMTVAGLNDEYTLAGDDVAKLGSLLTHIAVEAEFLRFTESEMSYIERAQKEQQAGAKSSGRAAAANQGAKS